MPSATLTSATPDEAAPAMSSSWSCGCLCRGTTPLHTRCSSTGSFDARKSWDPSLFQVTLHTYCPTGSNRPRAGQRRARSCHRTFPKTPPLRTRDSGSSDSAPLLDSRREKREDNSGLADIKYWGMVDAYHQQTLKLKDIVKCHHEKRQIIQTDAVRKTQQLNKVRRHLAAVNSLRSKKPWALSGNMRDLKRTLKWQAKILDEQAAEAIHCLETQDKNMETLFLDMMDATRHKSWNAKVDKHGEPNGSSHREDDLLSNTSHSSSLHSQCVTPTSDDSLPELLGSDREDAKVKEVRGLVGLADTAEALHGVDMHIPEWFDVLESQHCVPLLSKDRKSRYVELVNRIYRLDEEVRVEERGADGIGHNCTSPAPRKYKKFSATAEEQLLREFGEVFPRSQVVAGQFMAKKSAREQYDGLMGHVNKSMHLVAKRDKEIVRSELGNEPVHLLLKHTYTEVIAGQNEELHQE